MTAIARPELLKEPHPFAGLPRNHFGAILADPPWHFETWSPNGRDRSPDKHYQTMRLADIAALDVRSLARNDSSIGGGYWTRSNSEVCLLATRGSPKRLNANVRQAIIEPSREHSRKPDGVHQRIERLVGGPYCELFARQSRPGWTCWGNETGKFDSRNHSESAAESVS